MSMKMWRFFPVLVKEKILKNMDLLDRLSLSKCSKKTRNLLYCLPNHLQRVSINVEVQIDGNPISVNDFFALIHSRKSTIWNLTLKAHTAQDKFFLIDMIEHLENSQKILKIERLTMDIKAEHAELYKKILEICDPSVVKYMNFYQLYSVEMYKDIVQTPHWRHCRSIDFNSYSPSAKSEITYANIDDFSHFKSITLGVPTFSIEEAWKLIQGYRNQIEYRHIEIRPHQWIQDREILSKIENEWEGNWAQLQHPKRRYLMHPAKPKHVLQVDVWGSLFRGIVIHRCRFESRRAQRAM